MCPSSVGPGEGVTGRGPVPAPIRRCLDRRLSSTDDVCQLSQSDSTLTMGVFAMATSALNATKPPIVSLTSDHLCARPEEHHGRQVTAWMAPSYAMT